MMRVWPNRPKFSGLKRAMERLNPPAKPGTSPITRFEVIDYTLRSGANSRTWHNVIVEQSVQDEGRTLKIFVRSR